VKNWLCMTTKTLGVLHRGVFGVRYCASCTYRFESHTRDCVPWPRVVADGGRLEVRRERIQSGEFSSPAKVGETVDSVSVFVLSDDPVLQAGIVMQLRGRPLISVTDDVDDASVTVVVVDDLDDEARRLIRTVARTGLARVAVVATRLDESSLLGAVEAGAGAFIRRREASPERLSQVVLAAAAGNGSVPPDLISPLLDHVNRLQATLRDSHVVTFSGFSERELKVLRLVADGYDTAEIARRLCYSERTVKGVVHEITSRFQLKNRAQAVAYAVRQGLI
jgi:DNA-binding NarL/FixJ family response regulator